MKSNIAAKIDQIFEAWSNYSIKKWKLILLLSLTIGAVSGWKATKIELRSNFEAMLPEDFQSVKSLKRYQKEIAPTSTLRIGIMTKRENIEAAKKLADDIAEIITTQMKDKVHFIEYNVKDVRSFFKKHAILYMNLEEIKEKYQKINDYIGERKLKATGLLVEIDEEEDKQHHEQGDGKNAEDGKIESEKLDFDFTELINKYYAKASKMWGTREDGYYINADEDLLAMTVYPHPSFTGVENSRKLISDIDKKIKQLNPEKYSPNIKYGFSGPIAIGLEEYEAIKKDIVGTLGLCLALIFLDLIIFFLGMRPLFIIMFCVFYGMVLTLGLTEMVIGYLNAQTAFLGSIIAGTGINYVIILMARYMEERKNGLDFEQSLKLSMLTTWRATLSASTTTAAAFATFGLSKNLSFRQFGFIASSGVIIIWLVTIIIVPSVIVFNERIYPIVKTGQSKTPHISFIPPRIGRFIVSHTNLILVISVILVILSAGFIWRWIPDCLEYDFSKLRNKITFTSGSEALDKKISDECVYESSTPLVAVTDTLEDSIEYCRAIEKKKQSNPIKYGAGVCRTLMSFLPDNQEEKIEYLRKIEALLEKNKKLLPPKIADEFEKNRKMLQVNKISPAELPETIKRRFRNIHGKEGVVALISPERKKNIWKHENLVRFVETAAVVKTDSGKIITASGTPAIFYDIVKTVEHDAPADTVYSIIGIFFILFLIFGKAKDSLTVILTLISAISIMVGVIALIGVKINFFNFVAIPTAFGTGADYGINVLSRYIIEGKKWYDRDTVIKCLTNTGGAVLLCSSTTIIGYLSLLTSNNQALVLYGKLAISGELATIISALTILPALLIKFKV